MAEFAGLGGARCSSSHMRAPNTIDMLTITVPASFECGSATRRVDSPSCRPSGPYCDVADDRALLNAFAPSWMNDSATTGRRAASS